MGYIHLEYIIDSINLFLRPLGDGIIVIYLALFAAKMTPHSSAVQLLNLMKEYHDSVYSTTHFIYCNMRWPNPQVHFQTLL